MNPLSLSSSIVGPYQSGYSQPSTGRTMNNPFLDTRSETFVDDKFEQVEKRCFFVLCGKTSTDPAIAIDLGVNAFDDPRVKK